MKALFVLLCLFLRVLCAEEFAFEGTHFIASYLNCDKEAMVSIPSLEEAFIKAVEESGATVLGRNCHSFEGGGLTMVVLLSESHASIHTYPEHDACFIDLFTCGTSCSFQKFDRCLQQYLQPKEAQINILYRGDPVDDCPRSE